MALPFYNQGDQDIYAGGDHFIPQEQYRLNYTPSQIQASQIGNTGITNTQAASPYVWPPQGGGGGGGGFSNTNKFGLNLDTMKTISSGKYAEKGGPRNMYGGNYVKTPRDIAQDEHGNWKDVNTNQNVYHGNIQEFPSVIKSGLKLMGLDKKGDPFKGTWTGAEWDDEFDPTVAGKNLNIIQRWKAKREFKAAQEKAAADKAAQDAHNAQMASSGITVTSGGYQGGDEGRGRGGQGAFKEDTRSMRSAARSYTDAQGNTGYSRGRAQGGRIGLYAGGDPEEPAENIFEFMRDQDIPISEEVEGGPTEEQIAMVMDMDGKGIDMETISSITQLGKETIMNILGVEMANGGIARLL